MDNFSELVQEVTKIFNHIFKPDKIEPISMSFDYVVSLNKHEIVRFYYDQDLFFTFECTSENGKLALTGIKKDFGIFDEYIKSKIGIKTESIKEYHDTKYSGKLDCISYNDFLYFQDAKKFNI